MATTRDHPVPIDLNIIVMELVNDQYCSNEITKYIDRFAKSRTTEDARYLRQTVYDLCRRIYDNYVSFRHRTVTTRLVEDLISHYCIDRFELTHQLRKTYATWQWADISTMGQNIQSLVDFKLDCSDGKIDGVAIGKHMQKTYNPGSIPAPTEVFIEETEMPNDQLDSPAKNTDIAKRPEAIETITYVFGVPANKVSDTDIFNHIACMETEIKQLEAIEHKPKKLVARIEKIKSDIAALVALSDGIE